MTVRKCWRCQKEFDTEKDKYGILWLTGGHLCIDFLCWPCSERPEFKDLDIARNYQEDDR